MIKLGDNIPADPIAALPSCQAAMMEAFREGAYRIGREMRRRREVAIIKATQGRKEGEE